MLSLSATIHVACLYNQHVMLTITDPDKCVYNNGNCSHDCVSTEGSYYCKCPAGYILQLNKHDCKGENTDIPYIHTVYTVASVFYIYVMYLHTLIYCNTAVRCLTNIYIHMSLKGMQHPRRMSISVNPEYIHLTTLI